MCCLISLGVELHTWNLFVCIYAPSKVWKDIHRNLISVWMVKSEVIFTFFFELFHIV